MANEKILVVDDDTNICELLLRQGGPSVPLPRPQGI